MASHTHLLARKRQGSLINSTSQAAFLTKMSRWYYGKREKKQKSALHGVNMHFYQKRREREKQKGAKKTMDIDIQHESSHDPRNWNIFTFTPFDYLKKRFFHNLLLTQKDSSSDLEDFFLSIRMWQDHFVLFLHFIKIKMKWNKGYCWPYAWNKPTVY